MRRIRQVLMHCAYVAALIEVGACGSEDALGSSSEVEAAGSSHDLLFFKKHHAKKTKKHHHWDDCTEDAGTEDAGAPRMCQNLSLHVDSLKHREDVQKAEGTIKVTVPEKLDAFYWGKRVEAELTLQHGDKRVTCSYVARWHKGKNQAQSLELQRCDNGAEAGDSIEIDSASLRLDCSKWTAWAKVSVDLHEVEPCGVEPIPMEPTTPACDPTKLDDNNPCTRDFCGASGPQHDALSGTSCDDDNNVCTGVATCNENGECKRGAAPTAPSLPATAQCLTLACDPHNGWGTVPKPAGTSCSDNDVCNGVEVCDGSGTCAGDKPNINDGNPCTTDGCDPITGPTHLPLQDGAMVCGAQASCVAGKCEPFN